MTRRSMDEAIDEVAKSWRETARKAGVEMTQEQARDRVVRAKKRGDAKRDAGNR